MNYNKLIKDARKKAGLTQGELSELTGVTQSHISNIEKGRANPTFLTIEKLSKALDLIVNDVIFSRDDIERGI